MLRVQEKLSWCSRTGLQTAGAIVVALLCALHCCCCFAGAAVEEEPLVLHTSLVDLLNAENGLWTVSLGTLNAAYPPTVWTAMHEVHVEMQPSESAASLSFTQPPLSSSLHHTENAEEEYDGDGAATEERRAVLSDDVSTRTHRQGPFGHLATSLHGLSCEEYRTGGRGRQSSIQGRCFFLRDDGGDFFVRYEVKRVDTDAPKGYGEEAVTANTRTAVPRHRPARAQTQAAFSPQAKVKSGVAASESEPRIVHSTSQSGVWAENVPVLGGSASAAEEHVRIGDVIIDEYIQEMPDARRSKQTVLTFAMVTTPNVGASAAGSSGDVMHIRLECVTGVFYEDTVKRSAGAVKASRTSIFHRWLWPVMFVAAIYMMVAAAVRLVTWRKTSQGGATSATTGATKKHQ
ncbi:hypothetical protein JKF63_05667 [Porcisia hertigi]|uniref:Uncharacterized protein n=1 Tax=Porcisia hertigi TaxID=2761500 RepID=A0A836LB17_9TRYP|nr:hypothetical protein JKF63_05667 [Porcisia hertigi]